MLSDEEKAEEYAKGKAHEHYNFLFEENSGSPVDFAKLCYLDGLAEGRKEKWHDLRKDPADLPDTNREVLVLLWDYDNYHIGRYEEEYDDVIREKTYWHFDDFSIGKDKLDTVLGWFELPKVKR